MTRLCDDCDERPAVEVWSYEDAPMRGPPPDEYLCERCADRRRDRHAERGAEDAT